MAITHDDCGRPEDSSLAEPLLTAKLGNEEVNEEVEFLVDTGASYSVLNTIKGKLSNDSVTIIGAKVNCKSQLFFKPIDFELGKQTHPFSIYSIHQSISVGEIYWKT